MQIQKLVYFAHGWHMAIFGKELILERIEAWDYGPVIPSLYQAFKRYGSDEITKEDYHVWGPGVDPNDKEAIVLLRKIWEVYGGKTGLQLSSLTHAKDGPWYTTRMEEKKEFERIHLNVNIPNTVLKNYFKSRLAKSST